MNNSGELKLEGIRFVQEKHYQEKLRMQREYYEKMNGNKDTKMIEFIKEVNSNKNMNVSNLRKEHKTPVKRKVILGVMSGLALATLVTLGSKAIGGDRGSKEDLVEMIPTSESSEETSQIHKEEFLEMLRERYNSIVSNEEKIEKEDLGVIEERLGDGQVYKILDEDGNETYFQDYLAGMQGTLEGAEWIDGDKINKALVVTNKKDQTALTGVVKLNNGELAPLQVNNMLVKYGEEPVQASAHYIHLKQEKLESIKNQLEKVVEENKKSLEQEDDEPSL